MVAIPVFIVEEHHEALLVWEEAVRRKMIPKSKNVLLHVDEHSDMVLPSCRQSISAAFANPEEFQRFVYEELNIANFLYPAIYLEIFNRLYWLRQKHNSAISSQILCVHSARGEGRLLRTVAVEDPAHFFDPDRKAFRLTRIHTFDSVDFPNSPIVLDIDLDYLSCDNTKGESWEVEITQEAYTSFSNDPYNKLRLISCGIVDVNEKHGRYYLFRKAEEADLRVTEDAIVERIDALLEFLKRHEIRPALIDICRSRFSGYAPESQWKFMEETLLHRLGTMFTLNLNSHP